MKTDLQIAQQTPLAPIRDIAAEMGLRDSELELFGPHKAKVRLEALDRLQQRPQGKYIIVTAITPTPLGEGKTVTTIGLSEALCRLGKKAVTCIRQPSLGPVFGIKGGGTGGGRAQVLPMEDINLHLTGDTHAVLTANNLLAAFIDNHLFHGNELGLDPMRITWRRVAEVSDRALRYVALSPSGTTDEYERETAFDITAASEVMAILALASDLADMRARFGRIIAGWTGERKPVTADMLRAAGAMTVLMRHAVKPNLLQTTENTPCFVHAGPFANIAHGNSSIIADRMALRLGEYVVTEAGFGADCGAEKFFDIKCRVSGLRPNAVVLVASVRALKMHSGRIRVSPGRPLDPGLLREDLDALAAGCANLDKQIENVRLFGVPVVVAINRFDTDTDAEIALLGERAKAAGADDAVCSRVWAQGGAGGEELAEAVCRACDRPADFRFLYDLDAPIKRKIETIATTIYGADGVDYNSTATAAIDLYEANGLGTLPICMAKTHLSLSHNPKLKGRPEGFRMPVRDVRLSAGAGFVYPVCGRINTMPGLPSSPAGERVDIDENGLAVGLF